MKEVLHKKPSTGGAGAARSPAPIIRTRTNAGAGVIMRSALSDQAKTQWTSSNQSKAAIFDFLRANSPTSDADLLAYIGAIFSAGTDDLWLAETILKNGPEPLWPLAEIQERQKRAMTNSWAPEPGNIGADLGNTPGHKVKAFYFRGTSDRRALIIGGVHGSEAGGVEVVNDLLTLMRGPNAPMPFFSVIIVPELFAANVHSSRAQPDRRYSSGTVSGPRSIDPNRQFPAVGAAPVFDAKRNCMTDSESRCIEPENLVLIDLVNRFQPERVASIHGSTSTDPAKMVKEGGASVTTDPRSGHEAEDDALALTMAQEANKLGARVPANFLGDPKQRTRYPTSTASHDPGVTLGMWGSHDAPVQTGSTSMRPAMNIILVETFGNKTSADGTAAEKAKRGTELMSFAQVLQNFFLTAPPVAANPGGSTGSPGGSTGNPGTPPVVQPKLTVNDPGDVYEQEADDVAEQVMRMPDGAGPILSSGAGQQGAALTELQRKCAHCEDEEKEEHTQRKASGNRAPVPSMAVHETLRSAGQPLDPGTRSFMEARFGHDFGNVRIHNDQKAHQSARDINAFAYTSRNEISFAAGQFAPHTKSGRKLLAHELTHVLQQSGSSAGIQRAVDVDDVADEMNGKLFELTMDEPPLSAGNVVVIHAWNGTGPTATVDHIVMGVKTTVSVPKYKLKPSLAGAAGVRHYDTGVGAQSTAVKDSLKSVADQGTAVADWKAKEGRYTRNHAMWEASMRTLEAELQRRKTVADSKQKTMSRTLAREEMYNRFDTLIKKWVDYYNTAYAPATNLDSNMVKSILYRESKMGTSGFHLQLGPYSWDSADHNPIKSRFNLGQTIDSWPQQQYLMIKEMSPPIYAKYHLNDLERGAKWKSLTQQEALSTWNGGALYKAVQELSATKDAAGKNLMGNASDLAEDYEFWIRTCIKWLFLKYKSLSTPSWPEAIKAFNGAGLAAENYKTDVMGRVGSNTNISVQ